MKAVDTKASDPGFNGRDMSRNERRLLGLLFRRRSMTQLALAEETELTQQSVSRIVSEFIQAGLVVPGGKVSSGRRGYPSTSITLNPGYAYSAGIFIAVDAVSLALTDFSGNVCAETRISLPAVRVEPTLNWTLKALDAALADVGAPRTKLAGIGVAISGSFIEGGGFNTPRSLDEWAGRDLEALFSEHFGVKVYADNDGNCAATSEASLGVGRWANSFAYLYLGAGVGGGVILDGQLWRGRFGNAGEFAGGLPTNIYPFPNLELLRHLVVRDGQDFATVDELVASYDPSWSAIDDWIARVRDSLSIIASNATAILDLDAIVLGGRIPKDLAERVITHIELYDQKRRSVPRPTAKIVPAEARGEVAAIGAALRPLKELYFG